MEIYNNTVITIGNLYLLQQVNQILAINTCELTRFR